MSKRVHRAARLTAQDLMRETEFTIPLSMNIRAAAKLLGVIERDAAPVVDCRGRCVGVFTIADYQRWLERVSPDTVLAGEGQSSTSRAITEEVRFHIPSRFTSVMPSTCVQELVHLLSETSERFLVVLDRQARPRGMICDLDVLMSNSDEAARKSSPSELSESLEQMRASRAAVSPDMSKHVPFQATAAS